MVLTQHNDSARTGSNLTETELTPDRVKRGGFGKLFSLEVDDEVYAQPLYVPDVQVTARGRHDVVFVGTANNSVYAFDANDGMLLWKTNIGLIGGGAPVTAADVGQTCTPYTDFSKNIGIVSTPVIDAESGTLYVVARTKESSFVQRLHAISIFDGNERAGSPVLIQASVKGSGDGKDSLGNIAFNPQTENQRAALLLTKGTVVIAWASHCDTAPYHGWVMSYDAKTLEQTGVFNDTPNGAAGGIWQAGGGPIADDQGDVIVASGNGDYDGISNFGMSVLKLQSRTLTLLDWFTPSAWLLMSLFDLDFGSSGLILIPGTNSVAVGTKTGELYLTRASSPGKLVNQDTQIIQKLIADPTTSGTNHVHGGPVYWGGPNGPWLYVWGENDYLRAFALDGAQFTTNSISESTMKPPMGMPGGMLALSANGAVDGILWATHPTDGDANKGTRHGVLRAFDATDLTTELWNSMISPNDDFGNFAKFVSPTVVNGKVYVATFSNQVCVYGMRQR
jgi:outer membrane protein assembly factor BamB